MSIKIGMRVCVHGYWGTITDIEKYTRHNGKEVTRFKVKFDPCDISGTCYDNSFYGCYTEALEYMYTFKGA